MSKPLRLVIMAMMGGTPFAGVAWQVLHYLEGFRRLGHEVYYVEDTWDWPYDPEKNAITDDCRYTVNYIARLMEWCGLRERWAYCAAAQGNRMFGLSDSQVSRLFESADVIVNLTGATVLREQHLSGAPVFDEVRARVHAGSSREGRRNEQEDGRDYKQPELHGRNVPVAGRASRGR